MTKHAQIVFNGIHCFDPASRANLQAGTDPGQSMTNKKHKLYASRGGGRATSSLLNIQLCVQIA